METRHSERFDTSLPVMLQVIDGTRVPGVIRNVGNKGLFVKTTQPLTVNSEVVVTIDLSRERQTSRQQIAGVVVHSHDDGIGLYASGLDEVARHTMAQSVPISKQSHRPCVWYVTHGEA